MNASNTKQHMTSDEMTMAVVDRNDLAADRRAHLEDCGSCRERVSSFENQLKGMGEMARKMAPAPSKPIRLPQTGIKRSWQRKPILAVGFAALVLLAVVVWQPSPVSPPGGPSVASLDTAKEQRLIEDIDAIVENALPTAYQELAAFDIPDLFDDDTEDDPSDWIVPSLQEDEDEDFLS